MQEGQQVTVGGLKVQGQAVRLGANPPAHTHTPDLRPDLSATSNLTDRTTKPSVCLYLRLCVCINLSLVCVCVSSEVFDRVCACVCVCVTASIIHRGAGRCRQGGRAGGSEFTEKQKSPTTSIYHHSIVLRLPLLRAEEKNRQRGNDRTLNTSVPEGRKNDFW